MLYTLFILAVGIVIGWNIPRPIWAKELQDRVIYAFKTLVDKLGR